jgi:hypothetical protein
MFSIIRKSFESIGIISQSRNGFEKLEIRGMDFTHRMQQFSFLRIIDIS